MKKIATVLRSIAFASLAAPSACGCPEGETLYADVLLQDAGSPQPLSTQECGAICPASTQPGLDSLTCDAEGVLPDGRTHVACHWLCSGAGRRPAGDLVVGARSGRAGPSAAAGAYFAEMAAREAASVDAFEMLSRELAAHGAAAGLVARARRAAHDEAMHAERIGDLARQFGVDPYDARVTLPSAPRDLYVVAEENEIEGCVYEAFAAAVAWRQASASAEPRVRSTMARIARDESRHAELSYDIAAWARARLGSSHSARLNRSRRQAAARLRAALSSEAPPEPRSTGLPDPATALALFEAFEAHVLRATHHHNDA